MTLLLITLALLGIAIAGISIKLWAKKMGNLQELVQVKILCSTKKERLVGFVEKLQKNTKIAQNLNTPNCFSV